MAMPSEAMLIGGEWVEAAARRTLKVRNPATAEVIARVPDAGPEDADRAVRAARQAFEKGWRDTAPDAPSSRSWRR
jgi:acyl-CoA reductase-like NAD-dependent aldehyde dehydrogenase